MKDWWVSPISHPHYWGRWELADKHLPVPPSFRPPVLEVYPLSSSATTAVSLRRGGSLRGTPRLT